MTAGGKLPGSSFYGAEGTVALADLAHASTLAGQLEELRGASVVLATEGQLTAALALIELDGVARRIVLCPPDLPHQHFLEVIRTAEANALVGDLAGAGPEPIGTLMHITATATVTPTNALRRQSHETEWVLLTSGTTGAPKLVAHTLQSLAGLSRVPMPVEKCIWSTFYDIRRYGGLQIYLRAVLGGVSLVLSSAKESAADFLARAGAIGVTHISGTPTHWRRALMSGVAQRISPQYVRLSGEIADQALLDSLRLVYPKARIVHAFASTEAGVAFDIEDGKAGFPAELLDRPSSSGVELKIEDGTLRIRGVRNASRYLGAAAPALAQSDGFVDTGDMVELRSRRYYFVGRKGGVINVGGLKVHPEEVEAVINTHPRVRMSLVKARKNPITGAIVVAEVVRNGDSGQVSDPADTQVLTKEIIDTCRRALPAHKVPAMIRFVPALEVSASGKLVRPGA